MRAHEITRLAALKRDIAEGIADLKNGRFRTYTAENTEQMAEEISQRGRMRLKQLRQTAQRKK